ncbi:MAG: hypothetical protein H6550_13125 [Chitinophagales bacterium]|nr:hypothetical protein [Chitinophagales bacterium]
MKTLLFTVVFSSLAFIGYAQSSKIDLSKDPGSSNTPLHKKSNATLLKESSTTPATNTETNLSEQYSSDGTITNGTFRKAAPASNTGMDAQPQMMNATQQQGHIGNLKTTSQTYYDNSGKIRSSGTTIHLGK